MVIEYEIKDIGAISGDDEYIYLPKIKIEEITYCFSYSEKNYIMPGELNQTNFFNIQIKKSISKEEYFPILEKEFSNKDLGKNGFKRIKENISKIKNIFCKIREY